MKPCSSCGKAMEIDAAFCSNCGNRFIENANVKKCPSCGEAMKSSDAFCTRCGSRYEEYQSQGRGARSPIGTQLLELANDFLSVQEASPSRFEFSSQTGAQAPTEKVKIKYTAVAQLEPEKKRLMFWEQMVESSAGAKAGFSSDKSVQRGLAVSKEINGQLLFGGKYGFQYENLREMVKAIAVVQGWTFKAVSYKPKENRDPGIVDSDKSARVQKILILILALLFMMAIGVIGYLILSGRAKDAPSPVEQSTQAQSPSALENSSPEETDEANVLDQADSQEPKVFQKQGIVARGMPFVETDRDVYRDGEEIRVYFYNAPGYSRDWICIVPAGFRNTEAGDYQYIPKKGRGVLTFKPPHPGRYEVRAYYNYSPGRYVVSARHGFTVKN